ncbi:Uncharacterised protein [[Actinobacillus] rossii]|uniref:Uncharacterized protein n=1 Tax=[Actinobacillus] rossii TaxID=123820 RepID=A0A380TTT0_9PAST|nr:Uncharacterised protein [[Actinobacillus] rossii]SUT94140.1 Uncharacterised protein [[Actinobacillus] rossii]
MEGRLLFGISIGDRTFYDFKVQLLTLGGEVRAVEQIAELGLDTETSNQSVQMLVDMAYLAQQVEFVGMDKEKMNPEFLLDHLNPTDYDILTAAIGELRKKRIAAGERLNLSEKS